MENFQKSTPGTISEEVAALSLRILLVGKSGSGKSATGNTILRRPAFESKLWAQPVTSSCQREIGTWKQKNILVVDTPAIFDSKTQEVDKDIGDCYQLCAPGPHVLLLVTQLGRFTNQDIMVVRRVKEIFGPGVMRHMIVLFTHREDLGDDSLDFYVARTDNRNLSCLVKECGRRYCGFNNKDRGEEQVDKLMLLVERLVQKHKGSFYSNGPYLRQGEYRDHQENHKPYLPKVRQKIPKPRKKLNKDESNRDPAWSQNVDGSQQNSSTCRCC